MSKITVPHLAAAVAVGVLSFAFPAAASAAECTPTAAWDETVTIPAVPAVPAVGSPTITGTNPDYQPGTDGVPAQGSPTITVPNPAYVPATPDQATIVHHDAVTRTEWKYAKHGGRGEIWVDNDTFKYVDKYGTGSNVKPPYGDYFERTQKTRIVTVTDAWDEPVVIPGTPAVGEPTIEVPNPYYVPAVPGTPAIGEPTVEVPNPDYIPEIPGVPEEVRVVHHDAVICEAPATAPVRATARTAAAEVPGQLAQTGGEPSPWALGIAGVLLAGSAACAIGAGATILRRKGQDDDAR